MSKEANRVIRKVVTWKDYTPPTEWTYVLDCGHESGRYPDDVMVDEEKEKIEARGNTLACVECSRILEKASKLEEEAATLRKRLAGDPTKEEATDV